MHNEDLEGAYLFYRVLVVIAIILGLVAIL
jgi:hypothetical protein